jgi:hypothetical protein
MNLLVSDNQQLAANAQGVMLFTTCVSCPTSSPSLQGLAAYAHHAEALGATSPEVFAFVQEALHFLATPGAKDLNAVLGYAFRVGEVNFKVMEMLSNAHKST